MAASESTSGSSQATHSHEEASAEPTEQATCQPRVLKDESNFIQNVGQFYNTQDMSDVILKIGEEKYYGHKFVLAKSSEVFRTMLYSQSWTQRVASAAGDSGDPNHFSLPEIELEETEECRRSPLVQNALHWYSWSKALHMDELIEQCSRTIAWNAEPLLASSEWHNMDADFVNDLLRNGDLVVPREDTLFKGLLQWLDSEEHAEDYLQHAKRLLPLIRFPQMQVHELYAVEQCELYQNEEIRPLLEQLINKAYRFRSLCPQQTEIDVSFTDDFYLPRNYLDLTVDTVRMQNTLRFGIQVDVRTYVGPVPSMSRDGEWKITYRKSNDTWTLQIYCHESALVGGEARVQAALIITTQEGSVVQVEESDVTVCSRGNHLTMSITVPSASGQESCKTMAVLMKPLPR
ncbi:BTB/POZ domain-containing protein 17-like isoform X2 [Elysia marginata]|uniref:BTB/POZ domain-containing protein 17-like isoform X2 n=1 Tax=Elysia marginata TaxID=1093978 RepID=A0AAV4G287_9GAST|nr:BTB/POZ domain-containing protein 17-like isoform X2 [Elysia marginata]